MRERGDLLWARQRAKGEGEAGEQSTVHQENAQKQPPANAHASAMHPHIPATVARGKYAARERSEGGNVARGARLHGKRRGMGRDTARGCGSRSEHVGDAGVS